MAGRTKQSPELTEEIKREYTDSERKHKELLALYRNEPKVEVYLTPMYAPYFGNVMTVTINGISIRFKVNGQSQMVPETFATEINSRRIAIDEMLRKQHRMANIHNNLERSPGELKLF